MGDIVQLSLYFRTNDIIMLNDIKEAFLQIRLAREEDRNCFRFFMKEGKKCCIQIQGNYFLGLMLVPSYLIMCLSITQGLTKMISFSAVDV